MDVVKPQSLKSKGREFQKALVKQILDTFPELQEGDVEWCSMGASGIDIKLSPKARAHFPVSIEAKNTKEKPGPGAMRQSEHNAYEGTVPVVAWKPKGANMYDSMIMLKTKDFLEIMRRLDEQP